MKKILLASIAIIGLSFIIGIFTYNSLPANIASHWNSLGEVNGYMPKIWGIFLMPIISLALLILFYFIPKIDPLKENIKKFQNYYYSFILVIIIFMFYIYLLTVIWNFGINFNMTRALIPALGILFFYIGIILKHIKRNWFMGIRTPWTISNDRVWKKTHDLGSILFKISGVIAIIGLFFPNYVLWFALLPIILSSIWLMIYSYLEYRKLKK